MTFQVQEQADEACTRLSQHLSCEPGDSQLISYLASFISQLTIGVVTLDARNCNANKVTLLSISSSHCNVKRVAYTERFAFDE